MPADDAGSGDARLDAILRRGDDAAPAAESDEGSGMCSRRPSRATPSRNLSVDRAHGGETRTAYRMLGCPTLDNLAVSHKNKADIIRHVTSPAIA